LAAIGAQIGVAAAQEKKEARLVGDEGQRVEDLGIRRESHLFPAVTSVGCPKKL
jgi:hypothetical protein